MNRVEMHTVHIARMTREQKPVNSPLDQSIWLSMIKIVTVWEATYFDFFA
jgi:hypothetical protein